MTNHIEQQDEADSLWIDRQCDDFERTWRAGLQPRIEDVIQPVSVEKRELLFRELLGVELELRQRNNERIERPDYERRFPEFRHVLQEYDKSFGSLAEATSEFDRVDMPNTASTYTRYRDLRVYRRGGLGVLYRAVDESLHRETVIKFMNDSCERKPELKTQFQVEAEITSRLDHPGIVPVYGIGQDTLGRFFYVMRLINGRDLRQAIQEYHLIKPTSRNWQERHALLCTLLEHVVSACRTVAYAHHVGILHCDIKPANIMIGKYGETYVLDWGLATSFERTPTYLVIGEPTMRPHSASGGSSSGQRGGTYGYVSPEQLCTDGPLAPTSDVYSLGATLYEVLTGRPAFNGREHDVAEQVRIGRFPPPRGIDRRIPAELEAICLKAMHLSPDMRYSSAQLLAADITNWLRDGEVLALPDGVVRRLARVARRHWDRTLAVFIVLLTLVFAVAWTDRSFRYAQNERTQRENAEKLRELEKVKVATEKQGFTTALDTFEDLCSPLANGEMHNLALFRPFVDKIKMFTINYLDKFEGMESMQLNTARVFELRGTIARVYSSDQSQALADYQRAGSIYRKLSDDKTSDPLQTERLARVLLNEGRLYIRDDNFDSAQLSFETALRTLEHEGMANSSSPEARRYLAEAYHGLSEVDYYRELSGVARRQALQEAEKHLLKSKLIREQLLNESTGDSRRNYERDLARNWGYLGAVYADLGDLPRAKKAYETSKSLRESLYRGSPLDPEHRFQYARGLRNLGEFEFEYGGNLALAVETLIKVRDFQSSLTDDFPEVIAFWSDYAYTLEVLAEASLLLSTRDDSPAADLVKQSRTTSDQAAAIYGRLYRSRGNPRETTGVHGLASTMVLSALLDQSSNPTSAARAAQDAESMLKQHFPEQTMSSSQLITLAMARSIQNDPPSALRLIKEAVERGENSVFRLESHSTLAWRSIFANEETRGEFQKICDKLRESMTSE